MLRMILPTHPGDGLGHRSYAKVGHVQTRKVPRTLHVQVPVLTLPL